MSTNTGLIIHTFDLKVSGLFQRVIHEEKDRKESHSQRERKKKEFVDKGKKWKKRRKELLKERFEQEFYND